jgi:hypothetical protein
MFLSSRYYAESSLANYMTPLTARFRLLYYWCRGSVQFRLRLYYDCSRYVSGGGGGGGGGDGGGGGG